MKVELDPFSSAERPAAIELPFSDPSSFEVSAELLNPDPAFSSAGPAPFLLPDAATPTHVEAELVAPFAATAPVLPPSRLLDVTLAVTLLLVLSPLVLATVLLVRLSGPGPIIFRHKRVGQGGAEFECLKFRTMVHGADAMIAPLVAASEQYRTEWLQGQKILDDPRITRIGRTLRRYSIDELPQLLNVLSGEMSIVGPRPIVRDEITRYGTHFGDYCRVKPGMTGLWQVSGRNALPYETRVQLDAAYGRSKCLRLDLIILLRTVPVVLLGRGC